MQVGVAQMRMDFTRWRADRAEPTCERQLLVDRYLRLIAQEHEMAREERVDHARAIGVGSPGTHIEADDLDTKRPRKRAQLDPHAATTYCVQGDL